MKNIVQCMMILGSVSLASFAHAADTVIPLFTATSNAFAGSLEVKLTVDENFDATGILYSMQGEQKAISIAELSKGVVIYQMSGKNVAYLSSENATAQKGGDVTLTYLRDGVRNYYADFDFSLGRTGQNWSTYTVDTRGTPKTFNTMFLTAKKLLGKIVGIDYVTVK